MTNTETTDVPAAAPAEATATEETKPKAKPAAGGAAVPRPDRKQVEKATGVLQADIDKINEEIKGFDANIERIKKEIEAVNASRSGEMDELGKERAKRDEIKAELDKLKKERDDLSAELDRLKGKVDSALESSKSAKAQLKFRTVAEIDAEIARLDQKQSTTSMSLAEEKKIVKDIELLRGQKRQLATLGASQDQIKSDKDARASVAADLKAKREQVTECLARLNAQREVVDKIANKDGDKKGKIPTLIEERKAFSEKKKEAVGRIREIQKQIKAKWEEFKAKNEEWKAWFEEEKKVRDAERKARQEEYLRKLEEEEAKKVPYEEEMALCDYLAKYLQQTFLTEDGQPPKDAEGASAAPAGGAFEHDGVKLQAFKREDDEEEMWVAGAGKKKQASKKGGNKAAKKETINHSPETIASFALLKLDAPAKKADVEASITALKEKKQWYSVQPRPPRKTAEERAAELAEKEAAKDQKPKKEKKQPKEFKSSDEDFPALGGAPAKANGNAVQA